MCNFCIITLLYQEIFVPLQGYIAYSRIKYDEDFL